MFHFFQKKYSPQEQKMFKFLKLNHLLKYLTDEELSCFLPYLHLRNYTQNEVVFFRNDPSQALYILKKGTISLNLDIRQKVEHLYYAQEGDCFGESSILPHQKRLYNAVGVSENIEVFVIPQINIQSVFEENPKLKSKVLEAYGELLYKQLHAIFRTYRESLGFFELDYAFQRLQNRPLPSDETEFE